MMINEFPSVCFVEGPRRGLGANRNNAISHATGDYILFLDDDARLGSEFLNHALSEFERSGDPLMTIVTGLEDNRGVLVYPHDQSFLGFQRAPYGAGAKLNTIVINSTLFPNSLFDKVQFDEQLVYGYDEVDIASRAVALGYRIVLCESAINQHFPSAINRDLYRSFVDASRLYVTYRRYRETDRKPLKSMVFLGAATAHLFAVRAKRNGLSGIREAAKAFRLSTRYLRQSRFGASR